MRILVTGSREWRDYETIRRTLAEYPTGSIIVHGAATGADAMAHSAALALGFTPEPHFPDYEKYPVSKAPLRRNEMMVALGADVCLAFPTRNSRGTHHCAGRAKAAGIDVVVVPVETPKMMQSVWPAKAGEATVAMEDLMPDEPVETP